MQLHWDEIEVRDLRPEDVGLWHRFSGSLAAGEIAVLLQEALVAPHEAPIQVVECLGRAIGLHALRGRIVDQAEIYTCVWDERARGAGAGLISGVKAAKALIRRLQLKRVFAKFPRENPFAKRALDDLPVRWIREEDIAEGFQSAGKIADVYVAEWGDLSCLEQFLKARNPGSVRLRAVSG